VRMLALAGGLTAGLAATPAVAAPATLKGKLYLSARDAAHGTEVWRTDGTKAGTKFVVDVNKGDDDAFPGPDSSSPSGFTRLGDRVVFAANDGVKGLEVWRTNGTKAGTKLLKNINPGDDDGVPGPDGSAPSGFEKLGKRLYFGANDGTNGSELWRTDGTRKGTRRVKDIFPGAVGSAPSGLFRRGNHIYFRAHDGTSGAEVWRTDGTKQGTKLLDDINPGPGSSLPSAFSALGKRIYFRADDSMHGAEPWKTTGKPGDAKLLKDINPGGAGSDPIAFTRLGDRLYFAAEDGVHGSELWRTDGKRKGTKLLKNIDPGDDDGVPGPDESNPFDLVTVAKRVFFSASDGIRGRELWRTDGSRKGTRIVRNILAGSGSPFPCELTRFRKRVLFGALTPARGYELWKSDGSRNGTRLLKDIDPGPTSGAPFGCD